MLYDLTKECWEARLPGSNEIYKMHLPGTLDENGIGHADRLDNSCHPDEGTGQKFDDDVIATRFTRRYTYEGPAYFTRKLEYKLSPGRRVFLEAERARCLTLRVDGNEVVHDEEATISTPQVFELTALLAKEGEHSLELCSDNSYPGLPHDAIVYSSAATDETQTNWNGIVGYLRLREEPQTFISHLRAYPVGEYLEVQAELNAGDDFEGRLEISSPALEATHTQIIFASAGKSTLTTGKLKLKIDVQRWDEYDGQLYELKAALLEGRRASVADEKTIGFGIRSFGDDGRGHLALNGRRIFLRSEANCAEFPETGYIPMEKAAWISILETYKSYGINYMRFHSHCPPEAAFAAADELGILMQPELSHWNPRTALESDEGYRYYESELRSILLAYANHPSFVAITLGNELAAGELGHERMSAMLAMAKRIDSTRRYANASNAHYGYRGCDTDSDFYTSQSFYNYKIRATCAGNPEGEEESRRVEEYEKTTGKRAKCSLKGYLNNKYPSANTNYDASMAKLRESYSKPVFSFEVGQYEILPDFDELDCFKGISDPANYRRIQSLVWQASLENEWKRYVEATGELSRICYREEIEAAMRTEELSGISLLGLQDFPGQGTALVGMLNSHLQPKPYDFARPEHFRRFFTDRLLLVLLEKYTYEKGERLCAEVRLANYSRESAEGRLEWKLCTQESSILMSGSLGECSCACSGLTTIGRLEIPMDFADVPARLDLTVSLGELENSYPLWVYDGKIPQCPEDVYQSEKPDDSVKKVLDAGGVVYLSPRSDSASIPNSIQGQFSTDFWSVGTFGRQEGGMGLLIDETHPMFKSFPTEAHTNWQWWPMAGQRAVILPRRINVIVTQMDSYAFLRPMAMLFECRVGRGKLLYSSMGLQELTKYPEAKALLAAIYRYLKSEDFAPQQEMTWDEIEGLFR